jgi:hypothetical protein
MATGSDTSKNKPNALSLALQCAPEYLSCVHAAASLRGQEWFEDSVVGGGRSKVALPYRCVMLHARVTSLGAAFSFFAALLLSCSPALPLSCISCRATGFDSASPLPTGNLPSSSRRAVPPTLQYCCTNALEWCRGVGVGIL